MGKKLVKNVMTGLAILSALGITAAPVFAAIPAGTVVFGNGTAFDLGYANNTANTAAISSAVVASNGKVWVEDFSKNLIDNNTGKSVANSVAPTTMTYTDSTGKTSPITNDATTVTGVSAINSTVVTVTLANVPTVLPAASAFQVTDTNSNTYAATTLTADLTPGEYTLTLGTAVTGAGTLTVAYGSSSASMKFDTTTAGTTLSIEPSAKLTSGLVSDGADNTIITVDVMQNGVINKAFNGTVLFTSLKGATFAKSEVAFDQGKASVQLTSIASAVPIVDTIIATINNANDQANVGKMTQISVTYSPQAGTKTANPVFATVVEGNTCGDVNVTFNTTFNFANLYADWVKNPGIITVMDSANVQHTIMDIRSVNSTTVDLVLSEANALPDNSTVTVLTSTSSDPTKATLLPSKLTYNLVDATAPAAVGLTTPDYRTLVAQFTEPIVGVNSANTLDVLNPANWVLNGTRLSAVDVVSIQYGKAISDNTIKAYVPSATAPVDNRNYVTITLSAAGKGVMNGLNLLKAPGMTNLLQAYNVEDYAGLTDLSGQNYATTQEFTFTSPVAPSAPTVTSVAMDSQSPEQFIVTFNQPLANTLSKADFAFKYETAVLADKVTADWVNSAAIPTQDPVDARVAADVTVTPIPNTQNQQYLINMNQDWTVTDNTAVTGINYYAPQHNMVQITALHGNVVNLANVAMVADSVNPITMGLDSSSPTIAVAKQEFDVKAVPSVPLQFFDVTMSEPVQMVTATPPSPNDSKILTPSQKQSTGTGIPTPTFQFVNADQSSTIDGVLSSPIDVTNKNFTVAPLSPLANGQWTLYIRSISDQVGNTSATTSYLLNVQGVTVTGTPNIIWADAHDNVGVPGGTANADIVDIQFGTTMSTDALKSTMYTINGSVLPVGTMITSKVVQYDALHKVSGTLVTLTLPSTFLGDMSTAVDTTVVTGTSTTPDIFSAANTPNILNVSKSLTAADGTTLIVAPTQVQMSYGTPQDLAGGVIVTPVPVSATAATVTTVAGTAPVLPATVAVKMSDGSTQNLPVTWTAPTASQYAAAGTFTATGMVTGSTVAATATVTVTAVTPVGTLSIVGKPKANLMLGNLSVTVNDATKVAKVMVNNVQVTVTPLGNVYTVPIGDATDYVVFVATDGTSVVAQGVPPVASGLTVTSGKFNALLGFYQVTVNDSSLVKSISLDGVSYTIGAAAGADGVAATVVNATNIKVTGLAGAPTKVNLVSTSGTPVTVQ